MGQKGHPGPGLRAMVRGQYRGGKPGPDARDRGREHPGPEKRSLPDPKRSQCLRHRESRRRDPVPGEAGRNRRHGGIGSGAAHRQEKGGRQRIQPPDSNAGSRRRPGKARAGPDDDLPCAARKARAKRRKDEQ